jgi:predicted nuclease of predicted toxin-antitoxin system
MKLLFDHNVSPRLIERLADVFPVASHVQIVGLDQATDIDVWEYARIHNFAIVTKDMDFNDLSIIRGFPPKVIWLRTGNCTTAQLEAILRSHAPTIVAFLCDATTGLLEVQ